MAEELNEQKIKIVPKETPEIGVDTNGDFAQTIIQAAQVGTLDISSIDALSNSAQNRERLYELIDSMSQDGELSAVLSTYASDATQIADNGKVCWVESSDPNVANFVTWLLDSLNIDKNMYKWAHCLVSYGDIYVRLYRDSDYKNDIIFKNEKRTQKLNEAKDRVQEEGLSNDNKKLLHNIDDSNIINEDVNLKLYSKQDHYIPYVEMVANPGEIFDLQKFGKTYGYVQAPIRVIQSSQDELYTYVNRYKMKNTDVSIYDAMSFAHACLESTTQRQSETVSIFLSQSGKEFNLDDNNEDIVSSDYTVKRGQSILYNIFRTWRELNLLEMSALLNRLTKSSIVRVLNVDVGDMPKEQVQNFMQRLKEKIEQKSAINAGSSMAEYTNPGPIENTIYIPTHGTQGQITATTIGGDFDPKSLVDIDMFRNKMYGGLKVPKQYFGWTEDGAGFNGGTSLTILSNEYGKQVKMIINILCQLITDIANLFLIDRGMLNYINKFQIKMHYPVTQEELDRRANNDTKLRYVNDLMQSLQGIEDKPISELKIQKELLSTVLENTEVLAIIQSIIDKKEKEEALSKENEETDENNEETNAAQENEESLPNFDLGENSTESEETPLEAFSDNSNKEILVEKEDKEEDSYLPSPAELNISMTDDDLIKPEK